MGAKQRLTRTRQIKPIRVRLDSRLWNLAIEVLAARRQTFAEGLPQGGLSSCDYRLELECRDPGPVINPATIPTWSN